MPVPFIDKKRRKERRSKRAYRLFAQKRVWAALLGVAVVALAVWFWPRIAQIPHNLRDRAIAQSA